MINPEPEEAGTTLEGRYAITSSSGSATFSTLWFAKDGTYEAVLAKCTASCVQSGTFTFARGDLTLTPTEGPVSKLRINPGSATDGLTTNRLATRTTTTEATSATSDCKTGDSATSESLRAEGEPGGQAVSLLNGCASSLLNVLDKFSAGDEGDGKRVGDLPATKIAGADANGCWWPTKWKCWKDNVGFKCEDGGDCDNNTRDNCAKMGCTVREIYETKCGCRP